MEILINITDTRVLLSDLGMCMKLIRLRKKYGTVWDGNLLQFISRLQTNTISLTY